MQSWCRTAPPATARPGPSTPSSRTSADAIRAALAAERIPSRSYYEQALHLHAAFRASSEGPGSLPVTERLGRLNLSLPMHSELDAATVDRIAAIVVAAAA